MRMNPSPRSRLVLGVLAAASAVLIMPAARAKSDAAPMLTLLDRFTAPSVPAMGPAEVETARNWVTPETEPSHPGKGLAEHPMLYAGEGHNVVYLVNDGKVIWKYQAGKGGEIDDLWMLSNGDVLFARQFSIVEVSPDKQVVWRFDTPKGTESHTVQPVGLDKVAFVLNGLPPKLMVVEKKTGAVTFELPLGAQSLTDPKTVHPQFRRMRVTANGTYLLSFLKLARVAEIDAKGVEVWSYDIPTPWAAIRLKNGNTLITSEGEKLVREVNPKKETVWEIRQTDLPEDVRISHMQSAERLANGDTVIFGAGGAKTPEERSKLIQCVEVTPDKKVVWALQDWKDVGPGTSAQFLDQPGTPEIPGSLER